MNAIHPESPAADPRREVDRWLGNYSKDHRNSTNILIHWICVPLILWTAIARWPSSWNSWTVRRWPIA